MLIRAGGIGPPRLNVFAPDGAVVETTSKGIVHDGMVAGTEVRFTPDAPGAYRVDNADVAGDAGALLVLNAR